MVIPIAMQQVPEPGECATAAAASDTTPARWSRIPRVQLLSNKNDQRVPLYFDQTVPVWPPLRPPVRRSHSSNASRSPVAEGATGIAREYHGTHRGGYGVAKAARKFAGISQTVWFRSIKGALKTSNADAHACNVSEILRECSCDRTTMTESSKWSGIEQDLFTCTSVDPKVFVVPSAADFVSNKRSKNKGKSQSDPRD